MEELAIIKQFPLFKKLSDHELGKIASKVTEKTFAEGGVIYRRGEPGGNLYLIKHGMVQVILPLYRHDKSQVVSVIGEGKYFGELSFFDGKECSADVQANSDVTLLELKRSDYDDLIAADPEIGYDIQNKIILNLILTIRKMNAKFSFNVFLR